MFSTLSRSTAARTATAASDLPGEPETSRPTPGSRRGRAARGAIIAALLMLGLVTANGFGALAGTDEPAARQASQAATVPAGSITGEDLSVADVAELASAAVVTITATYDAPDVGRSPFGPGDDGDLPFPGDEQVPSGGAFATSVGSGFIIDTDGHVVTNSHVVEGAATYEVRFADGTTVPATLVGNDDYQDVAVLQLDLSGGVEVPGVVTLGSSDSVRPGETVVAIGSALGELTNTVSDGTVGAVDRAITAEGGASRLGNLIQHDAEIYSGNSGGPLLNLRGEVVGINTAKATGGALSNEDVDIGFAVAIDAATPLIDEIIADGEVDRPYLGIAGGLSRDGDGHTVVEVEPDGPAAAAGLEANDVITAIDGTPITVEEPLQDLLYTRRPGDTVTLTVSRDGEELEITVTLGERPEDFA